MTIVDLSHIFHPLIALILSMAKKDGRKSCSTLLMISFRLAKGMFSVFPIEDKSEHDISEFIAERYFNRWVVFAKRLHSNDEGQLKVTENLF